MTEQFVKRLITLGGIFMLLLAHAAAAQHGQGSGAPAAPPRPAPKPASAQQANLKLPPGASERRLGPMTSEERLQLRRDIDEHGREIYRERREPGRR